MTSPRPATCDNTHELMNHTLKHISSLPCGGSGAGNFKAGTVLPVTDELIFLQVAPATEGRQGKDEGDNIECNGDFALLATNGE